MPNDRNAGRKPKYGKVPLKLLQRKVPEKKWVEIGNRVDDILKEYQVPAAQVITDNIEAAYSRLPKEQHMAIKSISKEVSDVVKIKK